MADIQFLTNHTVTDKIKLQTFELPQNYSTLINKLEQLALGLDTAFENLSLNAKEFDLNAGGATNDLPLTEEIYASGRVPSPARAAHGHILSTIDDVEYSRVVSDIWIGVILTLLIVSVVFFICSCFLYHKFQQWKNSYRTNPNDPVEICRRYPAEFEVESLPSYTIVSGLPTYDDALEEFRKAGIILAPPTPIVKLFEKDAKDNQFYNLEAGLSDGLGNAAGAGDNISISSVCTCGVAANNNNNNSNNSINSNNSNNILNGLMTPNNSSASLVGGLNGSLAPQVIELSPEQLAALSKKRLSLQIAFNNSIRRNSRPRIDLYREVVNRNNLMRVRGATPGMQQQHQAMDILPPIHRSSSTISLSNEQNLFDRRMEQHLQHHRGSLC